MNITKAIIIEENINNDLWLKPVFAIIYIKNNRPTRAFQNLSSYKICTHKLRDLSYLWVLDLTIYIFLHNEE